MILGSTYVAEAEMVTKRWSILAEDPNVVAEDCKRQLEQHVIQEVVMEQIQTGLSKDLQARIDARGPRTLGELQQSIRGYQLQHEGTISERRVSFVN